MSLNLRSAFEKSKQSYFNPNGFSDATIIIDSSYISYVSLLSCWNALKKEYGLSDDPNYDATNNVDFRVGVEQKILYCINRLESSLGSTPSVNKAIFAVDCPKKQIWRTKIAPEYKLQRIMKTTPTPFDLKKGFGMVYNEIIPKLLTRYPQAKKIGVDTAEGDDIIACLVKHILPKETQKVILCNDRDYCQLLEPDNNLMLVDAFGKPTTLESESQKHKLLKENNQVLSAKDYLLKKILTGDPADNIKPIFKGCGNTTALKLVLNKKLLKEKLQDPLIKANFIKNTGLIDMSRIPETLVEAIKERYTSDSNIDNI